MGILVDTSVFIEAERGRLDLHALLWQRPAADFSLSAISASELLHGVHRATEDSIRAPRSAFVEWIFLKLQIWPVDLSVAREHAKLWANLRSAGLTIDAHDLWIAATCLAQDLSLLTNNERHFRRVPGLVVENWLQG